MLLCFGSFIMMPRRGADMCDLDHRALREALWRIAPVRHGMRLCYVLSAFAVYCLHRGGHMHPFDGVVPYGWRSRVGGLIDDAALANA
jgi:hypothetical protein